MGSTGSRAGRVAGDAARTAGPGRTQRTRGRPADAYEGYALLDPKGRKIGDVREVYCGWEERPEYVRAGVGPLGTRPVLIPVLDLAVDEDRRTLRLL